MAILNEIEDVVDRLMEKLDKEDCEEVVVIHVTRRIGLFRLKINDETYQRMSNGKWKKLI